MKEIKSNFCDEECKDICMKNGGGEECVTACGCDLNKILKEIKNFEFCDEECKDICMKNGGGEACVTACGCVF